MGRIYTIEIMTQTIQIYNKYNHVILGSSAKMKRYLADLHQLHRLRHVSVETENLHTGKEKNERIYNYTQSKTSHNLHFSVFTGIALLHVCHVAPCFLPSQIQIL